MMLVVNSGHLTDCGLRYRRGELIGPPILADNTEMHVHAGKIMCMYNNDDDAGYGKAESCILYDEVLDPFQGDLDGLVFLTPFLAFVALCTLAGLPALLTTHVCEPDYKLGKYGYHPYDSRAYIGVWNSYNPSCHTPLCISSHTTMSLSMIEHPQDHCRYVLSVVATVSLSTLHAAAVVIMYADALQLCEYLHCVITLYCACSWSGHTFVNVFW